MAQNFTRLEGAILTIMKAQLEILLSKGGFQNPVAQKYDTFLRSQFHPIINRVFACTPEEIAVSSEMLAREGLLEMRYNNQTGAEEGYIITKEGLIAARNLF